MMQGQMMAAPGMQGMVRPGAPMQQGGQMQVPGVQMQGMQPGMMGQQQGPRSTFMHNGSLIPGQGGPNMMQQPGMQQQAQQPAAAPPPAAAKSGLMGGLFGGMSKLTGAATTTAPSQMQQGQGHGEYYDSG